MLAYGLIPLENKNTCLRVWEEPDPTCALLPPDRLFQSKMEPSERRDLCRAASNLDVPDVFFPQKP